MGSALSTPFAGGRHRFHHALPIQIAERDVKRIVIAFSAEIARPRGTPARHIPPLRRTRGVAMSVSGQVDGGGEHWADLIAGIARERDREAFAELFVYFAPRVKAQLMKSGLAGPQAEDIAQETLISVWRKPDLFRVEDGGAATWIFTIARNLRIDAIRRERRGGVSRVSDVEAQFAVDESPLADARIEEIQSEERSERLGRRSRINYCTWWNFRISKRRRTPKSRCCSIFL
jgi:RNA polymerase sigma factor (sigma-70 family)